MIYAMRITSPLAAKVLNAATADYVSPVDDGAGPVTTWFKPIIAAPPSVSRRLGIQSGGRRITGSTGVVTLLNDAGALDAMPGGIYWNNAVEIRRGSPGAAWADLAPYFAGRISEATGDEGRVFLSLLDPTYGLQAELQQVFYAGTGGTEGGAELKNVPKPLGWGPMRNVPLQLLDAATLKWQGPSNGVNDAGGMYVNGASWTEDPAPAAGEFTFDPATGIFTLGSTPPGLVTADVEGGAAAGYVANLDAIVKKILVDQAGYTDPDSFGSVDLPAVPFGYWFAEKLTIADAMDRLAQAGGFWWGFTRAGLFQAAGFGQLRAVTAPVLDASLIRRIACTASPVPVYRVGVDYQRTWRVHTENELAGSVSDAERQRLMRPASTATVSGVAGGILKTLTGGRAAQLNIPGAFAEEADAQDLAQDWAVYFRSGSEWTVDLDLDDAPSDVTPALAAIDIGDSVTVQIDRFQMSAGRSFFVDGVADDGNRMTLTLVG